MRIQKRTPKRTFLRPERSLCSDQAWLELGRYVSTELGLSSVATEKSRARFSHLPVAEDIVSIKRFVAMSKSNPVPNPWSNRHLTEVSFRKYQQLCLRGFLVQGMLVLDDPGFAEARSIVENVGWMYTVLHVRPFCPRVVRECISNLYGSDAGVYIRGCRFDFDPVVINQLFMTPIVEQPHTWEDGDLSQAIAFLTGGRCTHWEPFSLTQLLPQYLCLYKLCELNWLPGFHVDAMLKKRLRFLFAFVREKPIDFGRLAYDQIIEMSRQSDADTKIVLPNLIYQTLNLQRDILALPGDEPLIGQPRNVSGLEADLSLRRGRRGRIHSDD
ncbi:hypothetical protein DY000_02023597 [Brassica cretica]|uniref:Putative plant transposon protein domain-containing protein n=1 Tax=Brassica cretica TaxID=69181 RepID=A0ABQ7E8N0_BRACR|nr:hypothetical protein DY000_02023597 [Brassica cretica]